MNKRNLLQLAVCSALAVLAAPAQAINFTQGDWNMDINGTVNGFYTNTNCSNNAGASQWATLSACNDNNNHSAIQNGLLPGWISFVATTRQNDLDIKAHFGFAPGTSFNGTGARGAQLLGDVRNVYLSFGDKSWGSVKAGRDIGLFQQQAILADMTLLGVGGMAQTSGALNTTTGLIGKGYMYTAFQPQITYSTPNYSGFQGSIGVFQPADVSSNVTAGPVYNVHSGPMLQGMATYDFPASNMTGKAWASFVSQSAKNAAGTSVDSSGFELGGKIGVAGFEGTLVGFDGKGIGDALLFAQGVDAAGNTMKTQGFLGQLTYKPPGLSTKFGVNYGETKNKDIPGAKNKAVTLGVYHSLTKSLTLVGEYIDEKTQQTSATDANGKTIALGAILFF
ncbi:MAG: porin [Burkholderiales bacterium]